MKYFIPLFFILFLVSCGQKSEEEGQEIPSNVLNEEKYAQLLVDFSKAESATNLNIKNLSGPKFDSAYAFNPLKENNISRALYDSTVSFYGKHPKLYKKVCEDVLVRLSKILAERTAAKKDSVIKTDSIANKDSLLNIGSPVKNNFVLKKARDAKKDSLVKSKAKKSRKKKKTS